MLFAFLTTLIVYSMKNVHDSYWCKTSISCLEVRTEWIFRTFAFSDKNSLHLPIISTLQFFWESEWSRSNPSSHKTNWHIPNIKNILFFIFLDNTSHKFWDQPPSPHYKSCLEVSETFSWHKLQCCYSSNMLATSSKREGPYLFLQSRPYKNFKKFFQKLTRSQ